MVCLEEFSEQMEVALPTEVTLLDVRCHWKAEGQSYVIYTWVFRTSDGCIFIRVKEALHNPFCNFIKSWSSKKS